MRYISFTTDGRHSWGRVEGDMVLDCGAAPGAPADLKSAIAANALEGSTGTAIPLSQVTLEPVIPNPGKILCVGHNYESHRVETGRDPTQYPSIFTRFADTLIAAGAPIVRPSVSTDLDYEAELAVVIGKGGRNIREEDALSHVAGYTCFNDASIRDWQWHSRQFTPGKNFPGTGAMGPELVTPDEISNLDEVSVELHLNGEVMQQATLDHMLFPVPVIIAYISQFTPLSPGDVIATGTPGGVGSKRNPPVWLKPGDDVEVRISGIGSLRNPVADER